MQIKGKTAMPGMKVDMGGSAAVLAAFRTLVKSGFKQELHCLLCIAENNISPDANKPDDIITMLSGKTVEISNTDAEVEFRKLFFQLTFSELLGTTCFG